MSGSREGGDAIWKRVKKKDLLQGEIWADSLKEWESKP